MGEPSSQEQDRSPEDGEWVAAAQYTSLHEAGIAQGILESAGIESLLDNEAMVGMLWHMSNALGGVRVRVRPAEFETARALLSKDVAEEPLEASAGVSASGLEEGDGEPTETSVEAMVRRALVASLLGLVIPVVLHLWSLTLLVQVPFERGRLAGRQKRRFAAALALTLLGLCTYVPAIAACVR